MKNILFVSHDPGGANVIQPVIEYAAHHSATITSWHLLLGPAKQRISVSGAHIHTLNPPTIPTPNFPNELSVREQDIEDLFRNTRFDAVFTATSFNSNLERLCIRHAKRQAIPTFAILDFWSNYRQRFSLEGSFDAPSVLFVADKRMQAEAQQELPETTVIISGNPHLQRIAVQYYERRKPLHNLIPKRIRFFSENIRHYYPHKPVNEFTVIPTFLQDIARLGFAEGEFLIRPHPMESSEPWEKFIGTHQHRIPQIRLALDTARFDDVLQDSCIAVGFTTMALLETASVGIPTFSYQIEVPEDYFNLPFEEYGITRLYHTNDLTALLHASSGHMHSNNVGTNEAVLSIMSHLAGILSLS